MAATQQLSIRLPSSLLEEVRSRGQATAFILEAVSEKLERLRQEELRSQLASLANDSDANDISDFVSAQEKVKQRVD